MIFLRSDSLFPASNIASLKYTDCNSTMNKLHRRFFLEYVPKNSCLNKNILEKRLRK